MEAHETESGLIIAILNKIRNKEDCTDMFLTFLAGFGSNYSKAFVYGYRSKGTNEQR